MVHSVSVKIEVPEFIKFQILKAENLNSLSNNLFSFIESSYDDSSYGIINGFNITSNNDNIKISKGIFKLKDKIYWLDKELSITLPKDEGRYTLLLELEEYKENDKNISELIFKFVDTDSLKKDSFIILEIIKRDGASISDTKDNYFYDRKEYNTINIINQKYSIARSKFYSISPIILKSYAIKLLKKEKLSFIDYNFVFFCLNSLVSRELLVAYINAKLKETNEILISNEEIMNKLTRILNSKNENTYEDFTNNKDDFVVI